jgi:hypothetical protein
MDEWLELTSCRSASGWCGAVLVERWCIIEKAFFGRFAPMVSAPSERSTTESVSQRIPW